MGIEQIVVQMIKPCSFPTIRKQSKAINFELLEIYPQGEVGGELPYERLGMLIGTFALHL